jgi:hypothetical protein
MNEYGAVEKYRQGKTEKLEEKPVMVLFCPLQPPHGLPWKRWQAGA